MDESAIRNPKSEISAQHSAGARPGLSLCCSFPRRWTAWSPTIGQTISRPISSNLATRYSDFFENCPVLKAETDELRTSRLILCDLTARTIKLGLNLLGIEVVERM